MKMVPSARTSRGTGNTRSFRSLGERSTESDSCVECAPGVSAGPPGRSMSQVGVNPFAEITAAPRGRVPVEDPQHVPGSGSPGTERVEVVQFERVLRVPSECDEGKNVLIEPLK